MNQLNKVQKMRQMYISFIKKIMYIWKIYYIVCKLNYLKSIEKRSNLESLNSQLPKLLCHKIIGILNPNKTNKTQKLLKIKIILPFYKLLIQFYVHEQYF